MGVARRAAERPAQCPRFLADPFEPAAIHAGPPTGCAQRVHSGAQICVMLRTLAPQDVALADECGDFARERGAAECGRREHEVRQARDESECGHLASVRRDAPVGVEGTQFREQRAASAERASRRCIEPAER